MFHFEISDLPGHMVAITSTCTMKLERFDEIRTRSKCNFENELLEMGSQLLTLRDIYCDRISYLGKIVIVWENYVMRNHGHIQNCMCYSLVTILRGKSF